MEEDVLYEINKGVLEEIAYIRQEAVRSMAIFDDMIKTKLREMSVPDHQPIQVVTQSDPSVILTIVRHGDDVEMFAMRNQSNFPPGTVSVPDQE